MNVEWIYLPDPDKQTMLHGFKQILAMQWTINNLFNDSKYKYS